MDAQLTFSGRALPSRTRSLPHNLSSVSCVCFRRCPSFLITHKIRLFSASIPLHSQRGARVQMFTPGDSCIGPPTPVAGSCQVLDGLYPPRSFSPLVFSFQPLRAHLRVSSRTRLSPTYLHPASRAPYGAVAYPPTSLPICKFHRFPR
ncbi:hypothetical protein BD311DRAFT_760722 [Dichomitus squalens]|uniref:Uncharacterized protein n=1 Tax=Dichomitus squalens TaxID=114155 RepID=A0A4Q9MIA4_9APHY|nr:hypothetical protein BD311DRAFT_760722 [Dichomitus squalens]